MRIMTDPDVNSANDAGPREVAGPRFDQAKNQSLNKLLPDETRLYRRAYTHNMPSVLCVASPEISCAVFPLQGRSGEAAGGRRPPWQRTRVRVLENTCLRSKDTCKDNLIDTCTVRNGAGPFCALQRWGKMGRWSYGRDNTPQGAIAAVWRGYRAAHDAQSARGAFCSCFHCG